MLGYILLTFFRDDILTQLGIDLVGIATMMGIAVLLTWYKANNAMNADAVIAASASFEIQRRSIAGIERHVIVWIQDLGRLWVRSKRPRTEVRWRPSLTL